ncbi:uncharacterized protein M6B38_164600 [Iris pallida]|uniref:Uncharacterized protein n=1 Tax=Iris pallida TaxID=29817 RepID=A0AAX6EXF9_IRIPA|nr:uncharacterized protein M6B38_164600 [Iris pallida]
MGAQRWLTARRLCKRWTRGHWPFIGIVAGRPGSVVTGSTVARRTGRAVTGTEEELVRGRHGYRARLSAERSKVYGGEGMLTALRGRRRSGGRVSTVRGRAFSAGGALAGGRGCGGR